MGESYSLVAILGEGGRESKRLAGGEVKIRWYMTKEDQTISLAGEGVYCLEASILLPSHTWSHCQLQLLPLISIFLMASHTWSHCQPLQLLPLISIFLTVHTPGAIASFSYFLPPPPVQWWRIHGIPHGGSCL